MDNKKLRKIIAYGGAASVFIGGMIGLPTNFIGDLLISIPLSIIAGFGAYHFYPVNEKKKSKELVDYINETAKNLGIDPKEIENSINEGTIKLKKIEENANNFRGPNTKRRVLRICKVGYKILDNFKTDPNDIKIARTWLNSHLDQCVEITEQYAKMSRSTHTTIAIQSKMAEFEEMLDLIEEKFNELLKKMTEDDLMHFDVNVQVFKNHLKNEGVI